MLLQQVARASDVVASGCVREKWLIFKKRRRSIGADSQFDVFETGVSDILDCGTRPEATVTVGEA